MNKVELLSPAGDLEKLKIAILYGADAVFCGGKQFSLRAKANNFSMEDLREAVIFANQHNAKVHVTVNIVQSSLPKKSAIRKNPSANGKAAMPCPPWRLP